MSTINKKISREDQKQVTVRYSFSSYYVFRHNGIIEGIIEGMIMIHIL